MQEAFRPDQRSAEVVGPGMVGAYDAPTLRRRLVREQLVAAVPAGVREHLHGVVMAHQQTADVADVDGPLGHRTTVLDRWQEIVDATEAGPNSRRTGCAAPSRAHRQR